MFDMLEIPIVEQGDSDIYHQVTTSDYSRSFAISQSCFKLLNDMG